MKPGITHDTGDCRAVADVLARVGDKWTVYVVGHLRGAPMRFNEIRRAIGGISQRMLTLTLRGLERDGLVTRTVYPTIPPRVIASTDRIVVALYGIARVGVGLQRCDSNRCDCCSGITNGCNPTTKEVTRAR